MVPQGPFPLTVGTALQIPPPLGKFPSVLLDNASSFACQVTAGGPREWLHAGTRHTFPLHPNDTPIITPTGPMPGITVPQGLYVTWLTPQDDLNGIPTGITATPPALAQTSTPLTITDAANATVTTTTPVLTNPGTSPLTVQAISVGFTASPGYGNSITVTVATSSGYQLATQTVTSSGPTPAPINLTGLSFALQAGDTLNVTLTAVSQSGQPITATGTAGVQYQP
jgi:hypothetical protein